jgi:non-haem dioxygenase in morphine synthesis N-terminal
MYKKGGNFGTGEISGDLSVVGDFTTIPLINVAGIYSKILEDRMAVAEKIRDACTRVGFFYIEGHGIPEEIVNKVFEMGEKFFELDFAEKMKLFVNNRPNYRGYTPLYGAGNPNKDNLGSKPAFTVKSVFPFSSFLPPRAALEYHFLTILQMPTKLSIGDTIQS